jgi:hypothetical protein
MSSLQAMMQAKKERDQQAQSQNHSLHDFLKQL